MRKKRTFPLRLGEKLLTTRLFLGYSQKQMWEAIKTDEVGDRSRISKFESGKLEPTTLELHNFTEEVRRKTNFILKMEHFADDSLDLPFLPDHRKKSRHSSSKNN